METCISAQKVVQANKGSSYGAAPDQVWKTCFTLIWSHLGAHWLEVITIFMQE